MRKAVNAMGFSARFGPRFPFLISEIAAPAAPQAHLGVSSPQLAPVLCGGGLFGSVADPFHAGTIPLSGPVVTAIPTRNIASPL